MRLGTALILAVLPVVAAASATAEGIRYTLSPVIENKALKALAVEMVLTGEADGETEIDLPSQWGGKRDLWRAISDFRVSAEGMSVVAGGDPAHKVIRHAPNSVLTVRYRVSQFWAGEPTAGTSNEYRPVVRPTYFHVIGYTVFARPTWDVATPAAMALSGFPKDWTVASDFEREGDRRALALNDILESVTVGGDFRVSTSGPLRVAIRGQWAFGDGDFIKRLEPIIASHHKFWGDARQPFLVTVLPLLAPPGHTSIGGTGLGDSFAFFATSTADDGRLTRLLAHEHLHSWIPRRIGSMPQEDDTTDYWLSEGFTEFYTFRLLLRDGMWSVEDWVNAANEVMWGYAFSPARNLANDRIARDFWSDASSGQMPYQRGFLFAALADDRVRRATKGAKDLDDVVLAMRGEAAKSGISVLARQLLVSNMKALGADPTDDIALLIEKGQTIALPEDSLAPCGSVATSEVAAFDRGFDGVRTIKNDNRATGVDPDGPAYAAGLRENMRILKLSLGEGGDSRQDLVFQVLVGGETREIRYRPEGKRLVTVQEIKPSAGFDRGACTARLSSELQ